MYNWIILLYTKDCKSTTLQLKKKKNRKKSTDLGKAIFPDSTISSRQLQYKDHFAKPGTKKE